MYKGMILMKYSKIILPQSITQEKGIESLHIQRLSNVIAFIGKNGSGKTRILDLIENNPCFIDTEFKDIPNNLKSNFYKLECIKELEILENEQKFRALDPSQQLKINSLKLQLKNDKIDTILPIIINEISKKYIRRIKNEEISSLHQALKDNSDHKSFEELIENIEKNVNRNEIASINQSSLKYLLKLPHKLVADENECMGDTNKLHTKISYKRFISLKKYIRIFLNKELEWDRKNTEGKFLDTPEGGFNITYHGFFKLDNREFNYNELSDGEKILFAYAILFFLIEQNQRLNIKESILIIDEPELHLHADSEIDLIEKLREVISEKGQLIIATHSINILSTLNYEELFVVKNGKIINPSQESFSVSISELIGIEKKINKLSDLLYSIDNWSLINFVSQCFVKPEVMKTAKENDPQLNVIKDIINNKANDSQNIFLDFGAGQGRILKGLLSDNNIFPKLKYYALELNLAYHSDLKNLGISKIYSNYNELSDNIFDFILLANVLHEIPITSWENIINKIIDSLKENGYLLIIEPKVLFKGEKIEDAGCIVLNEIAIQVLFELSYDISTFFNEENKEKITSVIIPKSELRKIDKKKNNKNT
jgi:predicted ATPase